MQLPSSLLVPKAGSEGGGRLCRTGPPFNFSGICGTRPQGGSGHVLPGRPYAQLTSRRVPVRAALRFRIRRFAQVLTFLALTASQPGAAVFHPAVGTGESTVTLTLGGTLGWTGKYSHTAWAMKHGLELVAERVNQSRPFAFSNGTSLALRLDIRDDKNRDDIVLDVYTQMAYERDDVSGFFGPLASELSGVAAEVTRYSGKLLLTAGTATVLHELSYPHLFSTSVPAPQHMIHSLRTLWHSGARSLSILTHGSNDNRAMCQHARERAVQLGFGPVHYLEYRREDLASKVQWLKKVRPDVLVGCGYQMHAAEITLTLRALHFFANGLLLTDAGSTSYAHAVGPSNANYIMAPSAWLPNSVTACDACPLYSSSQGFADDFYQTFNYSATPAAAQAAAAALAFLAAVAESETLDFEALRATMLNISRPTFYKRLRFNANGTLADVNSTTVQVQAYRVDNPAGRRKVEANIVEVGPTALPRYPMKSWLEKEVSVYPCDDGEQWVFGLANVTEIDGTCHVCPEGRYRDPRSTICETCAEGQYSDEVGMSECKECPDGADCPDGFRPGRPNASFGYFKLPKEDALVIEECHPMDTCLGNNTCKKHHVGILCARCEPGFFAPDHSDHAHECIVCPSKFEAISVLAAVVVVYTFLIALLIHLTKGASGQTRALHKVIVKISISYVQFSGIVFNAAEFDELIEGVGGSHYVAQPFLFSGSNVFTDPLHAFIGTECISYRSGFASYKLNVVCGLLLMPTAFTLKWLVRQAYLCGRSRKRRKEQDDASRSEAELEASRARWQANIVGARDETLSGGGSASRSFSPSPGVSPWNGSPSRMPRNVSFSVVTAKLNDLQDMAAQFIQSSIVMGFVLHPLTVHLLLSSFECVEMDVLRLKSNHDVLCNSTEHWFWVYLSTLGLVIFGLGMPLLLFVLLYRRRGSSLLSPETARKFGFLYNGYELHYYFFESIHMLRKPALQLAAMIPSRYSRMAGMISCVWGFIFIQTIFEPYDNRSYLCLDRLESQSLRALIATLLARLVYDAQEHLAGNWLDYQPKRLKTALFLVPMAFHAHFCIFAAWSFLRHTWLKHLALREEVLREQSCANGTLADWFFSTFIPKGNKLTYDDSRGAINYEHLSIAERKHLFVALTDTLNRYTMLHDELGTKAGHSLTDDPQHTMDQKSRGEVRPGLVGTAVKEAIAHSSFMRDERKQAIRELIMKKKHENTWQAQVHHLREEARMALYGPPATTPRNGATPKAGGTGSPSPKTVTRNSMQTMRSDCICRKGRDTGVTVEELHESLTQLWPFISRGDCDEEMRERLFRVTALSDNERAAVSYSNSAANQMFGEDSHGKFTHRSTGSHRSSNTDVELMEVERDCPMLPLPSRRMSNGRQHSAQSNVENDFVVLRMASQGNGSISSSSRAADVLTQESQETVLTQEVQDTVKTASQSEVEGISQSRAQGSPSQSPHKPKPTQEAEELPNILQQRRRGGSENHNVVKHCAPGREPAPAPRASEPSGPCPGSPPLVQALLRVAAKHPPSSPVAGAASPRADKGAASPRADRGSVQAVSPPRPPATRPKVPHSLLMAAQVTAARGSGGGRPGNEMQVRTQWAGPVEFLDAMSPTDPGAWIDNNTDEGDEGSPETLSNAGHGAEKGVMGAESQSPGPEPVSVV